MLQSNAEDHCIFCKIANQQIPCDYIYQDDQLLAFHDIHPAAPLHLLVIPKKHIATLAECSAEDLPVLAKMLALAPKLAQQHGYAYQNNQGGFRVVINVGPDGGQEVYHLHMHILGGARPWKRMA